MASPCHSFLGNFIQLIQLWAAICLLFFYQQLLEDSPLLNKLKKLDKEFKEFISSHQAVAIFGKSNEEKVYDPTKWSNFVPRIKNMAALTFFYCVFLLIYIGVEKSWGNFYPVTHPSFLVFSNFAVLLYIIICSIKDYKIFHKYRAPVCYILVLFVLFLFYEPFCKYTSGIKSFLSLHLRHENTWFWITIVTLIVCIIAMVLLIIRIWVNELVVKKKVSNLQRLDIKFNLFERIINEIIQVDRVSELSDNAIDIVKTLLSVDEKLFEKKRSFILKQLSLNHYLMNAHREAIDDLNKKNCYEQLESSTKKDIYSICANLNLYKIDKSLLIDKMTEIMRNDYYKERFEEALFPINDNGSKTNSNQP